MVGPVGTHDILIEDGRGGSVMGSLPIVVLPSNRPPLVEAQQATPAAPENLASPMPEQIPAPQPPAPFGLAEARALALRLPCALIDVREKRAPNGDGSWNVSGSALAGVAFEAFLQQLGGPARLAEVTIDRLDPGHCPALAVVTDLVRRNRERGAIRLIVPNSPVPVGAQLTITTQAVPDGALYIDLYVGDGTVQHLRRGTVPQSPGRIDVPVSAPASGPLGQRLVVAIAIPASLELAQRPTRESETAYLPALD
jgi:hypothetical protein